MACSDSFWPFGGGKGAQKGSKRALGPSQGVQGGTEEAPRRHRWGHQGGTKEAPRDELCILMGPRALKKRTKNDLTTRDQL